tara:strand:+ start:593 stop:1246 length:654 start_codon:yes stop_codon:yes gene_type:complete
MLESTLTEAQIEAFANTASVNAEMELDKRQDDHAMEMMEKAQKEEALSIIKNLAGEFHRSENTRSKVTDFLRVNFRIFLTSESTWEVEDAGTAIVQMWEAVCSNPKKCEIRKRNIASYKTLQNRETKKLNKELDNGLRALIVKDGEIVEAQLKKAKSKGGEEGGEEGGNTSTDAPIVVDNLDGFDAIAIFTDLKDGKKVSKADKEKAYDAAIKALSI